MKSLKNPFASSAPQRGVVTVITQDVEHVNKEMREHVLHKISVNLTELNQRQWIGPQTIDLMHDTLQTHNCEINTETSFTSSSSNAPRSASFSNPISPSRITLPSGPPPPLPSRGDNNAPSSKPPAPYRPTPKPPSSTSSPIPSPALPRSATTTGVPTSMGMGVGGFNANNPALQKAALGAAQNPAVQKAAFSAASNPAVQRGAMNALQEGAAASGNPHASAIASNPAFQKAALNAANNPAVQRAAVSAASNPNVQKAAFGAVQGQLGGTGVGSGGKRVVVAIADFGSTEDGDLPFKMGDLITVLEEVDENWYKGELKNRQGIFPKNYVQAR
ncbi:hypothetical protein HDU76_009204 [Blyttiomyces sp. JEL0837]|nr:hypothetical protein HDU76_009204 [Blyttiomyces sp. JEL0837]